MDRRIQKTQAAIQRAYFSLMNKKKTSRITISEIAREANIDRKTFYLHYDSIDDIVEKFSREKIQKLLSELDKINFFEQAFNVNSLFSVLNRIIDEDLDFYHYIAMNDSMDFFWIQIQEVIISTMKEVYYDKTNLITSQFDIYTRYVSTGFISVYRSWLKKEIHVSLDELGTIAAGVAYFGVQKIFTN